MSILPFGLDRLLDWYGPKSYRTWLNEKFSEEKRKRFLWSIALIFVFFSGFLAWKDEHEKVANLQKQVNEEVAGRLPTIKGYASVRVKKDGVLSVSYNLSAYGLSVKKIEFEGGPAYILTFEKEPEHFEVHPFEAASVEVVKVGPKVHRVKVIGLESERPIESDFSVTMSPLNM